MTIHRPTRNSSALVGFILGTLTLLLVPVAPIIAIIVAVFAVVISRRGLLATQHGTKGRRDLAVAGLTIGVVSFFIALALLIFPLVQPNIPIN